MSSLHPCALPPDSLLQRYAATHAYTDCYATQVAGAVSQATYVAAFYTTAPFKVERLLLRLFASRPSTDQEAVALAQGQRQAFAAWSVEERTPNQILLRDMTGRTRSWLMTAPCEDGTTRLYFGSAIVPPRDAAPGASPLDFPFSTLLGFHKLYSRVLLFAARSRLTS